jgi:PII-like signaling protein
VVVTKGVLLRIFVLQGQRHRGDLLYDWLLLRAREMGIAGGAAFREIAGYGRHDRLHEQSFFELAGDQPVEVVFATTEAEAQRFLDFLAHEALSLFYIRSPCEFGYTGNQEPSPDLG